jgi:hypothetical protein
MEILSVAAQKAGSTSIRSRGAWREPIKAFILWEAAELK